MNYRHHYFRIHDKHHNPEIKIKYIPMSKIESIISLNYSRDLEIWRQNTIIDSRCLKKIP